MRTASRWAPLLTFALLTLLSALASAEMTPSQVGRVLGGMTTAPFGPDADRARAARDYADTISAEWLDYEDDLGGPMVVWAAEHLDPAPGATIFYPFAGADFLTVHRLYPAAHRYVLVALQPAGRVPDLAAMPRRRFDAIIRLFSLATQHFSRRGFFITREMDAQYGSEDSPVEGITPMFLLMAEREGFEVLSVTPIEVADGGQDVRLLDPAAASDEQWASVRLSLRRRADDHLVTLDYLQIDLSDSSRTGLGGVDKHRAWVALMAQNPVVMKAASHLLQRSSGFNTMATLLLDHAPSVVQDETALPYRDLRRRFDQIDLFGRFLAVHDGFPGTPHPSLVRAFEDASDLPPIPFRYGYRKDAGYMIMYAHDRRAD